MLAYAANRPVAVDRHPHPHAMLVIIGVHVGLIAALLSARTQIEHRRAPDPPLIRVRLSPDPRPRPEAVTRVQPRPPLAPPLDQKKNIIKDDSDFLLPIAKDPVATDGSTGGGGVIIIPEVLNPIAHTDPTLPRLLTPAAKLKPPYPAEKLLNEEEAVLILKLSIDADGRVTSVAPVGKADDVFLNAARRYLIEHWRYAPATREGSAVPSTTVVTLHFELNG